MNKGTKNYQKKMIGENLTKLGKSTTYKYNQPQGEELESFPNPHPENSYKIELITNEFSSLCPKTGQPDFATIEIRYVPNMLCIETKSLKLFLFSFRQHGAFMEDITNTIMNEIYKRIQPKEIEVLGRFNSRGGILLNVYAKRTNNNG